MTMPLSLNEPEGLQPSSFAQSSMPSISLILSRWTSGVEPSPSVSFGVFSVTGNSSEYLSITPIINFLLLCTSRKYKNCRPRTGGTGGGITNSVAVPLHSAAQGRPSSALYRAHPDALSALSPLRHPLRGGLQIHSDKDLSAIRSSLCEGCELYYPRHRIVIIKFVGGIYTTPHRNCQAKFYV